MRSNSMEEFKLVILGSRAVGKSGVVFRYVCNEFVEEYNATIEDTYRKQVDNTSVVLDILDTGGEEEFRYLQDTWIKNGKGFLLIYDITKQQTFDEVKQIHSKIRRVKPDAPILLAGNKADLPNESRQVAKADGEALAKTWGCPFLETSAKNSSNVKAAFEDLTKLMIKENSSNVQANDKGKDQTNDKGKDQTNAQALIKDQTNDKGKDQTNVQALINKFSWKK